MLFPKILYLKISLPSAPDMHLSITRKPAFQFTQGNFTSLIREPLTSEPIILWSDDLDSSHLDAEEKKKKKAFWKHEQLLYLNPATLPTGQIIMYALLIDG